MPPIGETLREARVRQKIDVAEVERATKIRAKYLRALENEEFDRLPGSTYVRTFIRTYAEFLGLDPHLLVEEYRVRHEPPSEEELPHLAPPPAPRRHRGEGARRSGGGGGGSAPSRTTLIAGVALGVLLLFLVIGLITGGEEDTEPGGAPVTQPEQGKDREAGGRAQEEGDGRAPSKAPDEVVLRISPVDATYVCVDDGDGKRVFEGVLESPRRFEGETLLLNLGRTSAKLEVNGDPVKVEESSQAVGFEFTPEGERDLPVGERPCA